MSATELKLRTKFRLTLKVLLDATIYAEETTSNRWEFAVELDQLVGMGLTHNDFRWLVHMGLVEHQREVTLEGDDGRAFQPTGNLTFTVATCFILTDAGISVARAAGANGTRAASQTSPPFMDYRSSMVDNEKDSNGVHQAALNLPVWDGKRRELLVNGTMVKHLKASAHNQETILAVFEEEDWPMRIDDPLPPQPEQDPKRRLGDTIRCLNRNQAQRLIRFRGDGTGEGVIWELIEPMP